MVSGHTDEVLARLHNFILWQLAEKLCHSRNSGQQIVAYCLSTSVLVATMELLLSVFRSFVAMRA